jgi:hypothetical protein
MKRRRFIEVISKRDKSWLLPLLTPALAMNLPLGEAMRNCGFSIENFQFPISGKLGSWSQFAVRESVNLSKRIE